MRNEPYYRQEPIFEIRGLVLSIKPFRFSCGAIDPAHSAYVYRDLPLIDIAFTADPLFDKFATLYIVPSVTAGDSYYLTEWSSDPAKAETSNPPTEKWTAEISVVPCLNITIKAGAVTLEVTANEFDLPDPPDQRREIQTKIGQIKAWRKTQQPEGWELLDAQKHKKAFPISLGQLNRGENWYVLTPEAEEKLKKKKP